MHTTGEGRTESEEKGTDKIDRVLDIYTRLMNGDIVNKAAEAANYNVNERSIQRDLDDIRRFMDRKGVEDGVINTVVYDRAEKGFRLEQIYRFKFTNPEILTICKILLESRAFTKQEISVILDKIISGCVPRRNMKLVSDLISNEKFHYVELRHNADVKDLLWELGKEIRENNLIKITYLKQVSAKETVERVILPVGIIFSEYYFYLNAYIVEEKENGGYQQKYDYPAIFRVDRIQGYQETGEKFWMAYTERFEEGEFRKRVQFMFPGKLQKIRFRYSGKNVEAVLDRLPTAQVVSEDEKGQVLEAEVYGKGILMWILSQGSAVEVLKPESMREEVVGVLREMMERYG